MKISPIAAWTSLSLAVLLVSSACGREDRSEGRANRAAAPPNSPAPSQPVEMERLAREKWYGDLDGIAKRRILRVSVVPNKLGYFVDGPRVQGAIYEFTREFEKFLNTKLKTGDLAINVVFIPVARQRLIPMLASGKADLVTSLMAVSEANEHLVEFSAPLYDHAKAVLVTGPAAPPVSSLEDLSGKEVYCHENTIPYQKLSELSAAFQRRGKAPIKLTPADENLQPEDMFEMVNAGLVAMTVGENRWLQFWTKVLPHLQVHSNVVIAEGSIAWAMQDNTPQLKAVVDEFVRDHKVERAYENVILSKYLDGVKWAKDATSSSALTRFEQLVPYFRKYGDQYSFPSLLLAAQGYQESGLNPNMKSSAGGVGVMQIKPSTAAADPIDISDVQKTDKNIEADAKFLRFMMRAYYADDPMTPVTKGLFAIASYHAGANRIEALRAQAAAQGYDPNRWFNNVEIIASKEIGAETVQYVSNVYKYYLAYQMVTGGNAQGQASRQKEGTPR
jgi:membrane-bound lytic murein transglycosylase MltF